MQIDPETLGSFQLITVFLVVSVFNFAAGQALHAMKSMLRLGKETWQRAVTTFLVSLAGLGAVAWLIVILGLKVS